MKKKKETYVWGSGGLDQHASSDGGHGGGEGAGEALGCHQRAQVVVVSVDKTSQETTLDGQGRALNDGGVQDTGTGGTDVLVDAERVRCDREGVDGDLGRASGAVGEGDLGVGNGGNKEDGEGGDELHGWDSVLDRCWWREEELVFVG